MSFVFTGCKEYEDGTKLWLKEGKYHNESGPAKIWPDGSVEYWLNHYPVTKEEWTRLMQNSIVS